MEKRKKVVLSEKNIRLLASLAKHGSAKQVREDPNFALSLLLNEMKENPSHSVTGVLLNSLEPNVIEHIRGQAARKKRAA